MLLFGVFSLISFVIALPTPEGELTVHEKPLIEEAEILSPIPDPPELKPLHLSSELSGNKEKDNEGINEEIVDISEIVSHPDSVFVGIQENKPPSFIGNLLSGFSWPVLSLPNLEWPTMNLPTLSSISNWFGGRNIVQTNPNARYVLV